MKGFIASLVTIIISLLLLLQVIAIRESSHSFEQQSSSFQSLRHASLISDAVANDVAHILNFPINVYQNNVSSFLAISGTMPPSSPNSTLQNYADFIASDIAAKSHANISLNITNMTDGLTEINFFNRYDIAIDYENRTFLFLSPMSLAPKVYEFNITIAQYRDLVDQDITPGIGGPNLTLNYLDNNGSITWQGQLDPNMAHSLTVTYTNNKSFTLAIAFPGQYSLLAFDTNHTGFFTFAAEVPLLNASEPLSYYYSGELYYAQERMSKRAKISKNG